MISLLSDMHASGHSPSVIVFDIETGPLPLEVIEPLMPEFEAPANYKDLEKIRAAKEEKRLAWIERAALSPVTGQVVAIGAIVDGEYKSFICSDLYMAQEADALRWFWSLVEINTALIGFNSHRFDLPFLIRRSWALSVDVPLGLAGRYFRNSTDLMECWQLGDRGEMISLDRMAKFLGVGAKTGSGKMFAKLVQENPDAAAEYLRNDVELTAKCAARLGVIDYPGTLSEPTLQPVAAEEDY